MRPLALGLSLLLAACSTGAIAPAGSAPVTSPAPAAAVTNAIPTATPPPASSAPATPTGAPTAAPTFPACGSAACDAAIADAIGKIDPAKLNDHLVALTNVGSRNVSHPGHAKAVAYIKEQLNALAYYGWKIESQRATYQGMPLENIFASLDGATAASGGSSVPKP